MAADKGNTEGMYKFAKLLPKNGVRKFKYMKQAADNGNDDAMIWYALQLSAGYYIVSNKNESLKYYKMALEKESNKAKYSYSFLKKVDFYSIIQARQIEITGYIYYFDKIQNGQSRLDVEYRIDQELRYVLKNLN